MKYPAAWSQAKIADVESGRDALMDLETIAVEGEDRALAESWKDAELSEPAEDLVNHPKHYTSHPSGVECIEVTRWCSFNIGNVIKYCWRADLKGSTVQDLEKALWYLKDEIEKRKKSTAK